MLRRACSRLGIQPWTATAVLAVAVTHGIALAGGLIDADRVLLLKNNDLRSFSGLAAMFVKGEPIQRASGLIVYNHGPLGVLSTWLGWEWFRANALLQHGAGVALALAVVLAIHSLLAPRHGLAAAASLGLMLYPMAAEVTGPILGREALIAVWLCLLAARRVRDATPRAAIAWSAAASLAAALCSPGWGLLGWIPASMIARQSERRIATIGCLLVTLTVVVILRAQLQGVSALDAVGPGAAGAVIAWLPSVRPLAIATVRDSHIAGLVAAIVLPGAALLGSARVSAQHDAALLRAGAGAMIASVVASALACQEGTITSTASFFFHLGVVIALAGVLGAKAAWIEARRRPWMAWATAVLACGAALVTAIRVRGWAEEDRVLAATAARDPQDPEAILARARIALRAGSLGGALPDCARYAEAAPDTFRADGCLAAAELSLGNEREAAALMRRWASRFPEQRALRIAVLELSESRAHPRFGELFRHATGFNMPARRPGETR